jgi:hypothetical protein
VGNILNIFGIEFPEYGFVSSRSSSSSSVADANNIAPYIDALATFRKQVREAATKRKDCSEFLQLTDHVREPSLLPLFF